MMDNSEEGKTKQENEKTQKRSKELLYVDDDGSNRICNNFFQSIHQ
jgi:hypothetical protein